MTAEAKIRALAARIHDGDAARAELPAEVAAAWRDGVSVDDLIDWSCYSRRMIFYLIKEGIQ